MLPFPFSKGVFLWGTPIEVQKDADDGQLEEKRLEVELALIALTQRADWLMNQADIEPASTTSPAG
ncbi:MAG: hypothetical protein VW709_16415 [Rickettsiales bacterium]